MDFRQNVESPVEYKFDAWKLLMNALNQTRQCFLLNQAALGFNRESLVTLESIQEKPAITFCPQTGQVLYQVVVPALLGQIDNVAFPFLIAAHKPAFGNFRIPASCRVDLADTDIGKDLGSFFPQVIEIIHILGFNHDLREMRKQINRGRPAVKKGNTRISAGGQADRGQKHAMNQL